MPAETHSSTEPIDATAVLEFMANLCDVDPDAAGGTPLSEVDLDDDLAVLHMWDTLVEEFGERTLGDIDFDDELPATLGELADLFADATGLDPADAD